MTEGQTRGRWSTEVVVRRGGPSNAVRLPPLPRRGACLLQPRRDVPPLAVKPAPWRRLGLQRPPGGLYARCGQVELEPGGVAIVVTGGAPACGERVEDG